MSKEEAKAWMKKHTKDFSDEKINSMDLADVKKLLKQTKNGWDMPENRELMRKLEARIKKEDPNYLKTKK
jgi:Fe-S cluster biosynthesis and repair protein YggX